MRFFHTLCDIFAWLQIISDTCDTPCRRGYRYVVLDIRKMSENRGCRFLARNFQVLTAVAAWYFARLDKSEDHIQTEEGQGRRSWEEGQLFVMGLAVALAVFTTLLTCLVLRPLTRRVLDCRWTIAVEFWPRLDVYLHTSPPAVCCAGGVELFAFRGKTRYFRWRRREREGAGEFVTVFAACFASYFISLQLFCWFVKPTVNFRSLLTRHWCQSWKYQEIETCTFKILSEILAHWSCVL